MFGAVVALGATTEAGAGAGAGLGLAPTALAGAALEEAAKGVDVVGTVLLLGADVPLTYAVATATAHGPSSVQSPAAPERINQLVMSTVHLMSMSIPPGTSGI